MKGIENISKLTKWTWGSVSWKDHCRVGGQNWQVKSNFVPGSSKLRSFGSVFKTDHMGPNTSSLSLIRFIEYVRQFIAFDKIQEGADGSAFSSGRVLNIFSQQRLVFNKTLAFHCMSRRYQHFPHFSAIWILWLVENGYFSKSIFAMSWGVISCVLSST